MEVRWLAPGCTSAGLQGVHGRGHKIGRLLFCNDTHQRGVHRRKFLLLNGDERQLDTNRHDSTALYLRRPGYAFCPEATAHLLSMT